MDGSKQPMKSAVRIRVKKEDVHFHPVASQDGLAICLDCWKDWMLSDDRDLSASRMKLEGGNTEGAEHEGYETNPYDEQRKADMKIGEATHAMIEDLKPCWRWAIHKKMGVSDVWNFPLLDLLSTLDAAQAELESKLRNHIATATQFL